MNLVVRPSKIGLGAFSARPFAKGETVVDWSDHPFFAEPPQIPADWRFVQASPGVYIGPVGPEKYPDAYINHSCDPNAGIRWARPEIWLVALRDISQDEEITFDYATFYRRPWSMKCVCGSGSCRGTILGC